MYSNRIWCFLKVLISPLIMPSLGKTNENSSKLMNFLFVGSNCQFKTCFGLSSTYPKVCSGNGICSSLDNCTCNSGYSGSSCNVAPAIQCFGINSTSPNVCSTAGQCTSLDTCVCNTLYSGNMCQNFQCFGILMSNNTVCNSQSNCTSPNNCSCKKIYSGV